MVASIDSSSEPSTALPRKLFASILRRGGESETLEFKADVPDVPDGKEIGASIAAFAKARGGQIIRVGGTHFVMK